MRTNTAIDITTRITIPTKYLEFFRKVIINNKSIRARPRMYTVLATMFRTLTINMVNS